MFFLNTFYTFSLIFISFFT